MLPPRALAPLVAAGALGLVLAVVLGIVFAGQSTGTRLDAWVAAVVELPPGSAPIRYPLCIVIQGFADPLPAAGIVAALALACWWRGCRRLAALAVLAPAVTDVVVIAAKHLVGRTIHGSLSYPSTHAAHSAAVAMVVMLLAITLLDRGRRFTAALVLAAAAVATAVMGWALVAGSVHYLTDVLGGLGVALAALPLVGYGIDRVGDRLSGTSPAWIGGSTRTARPGRSAGRDGRPPAGIRTPR